MYTVLKDNVRKLKDYNFCELHELSDEYISTFCEEIGIEVSNQFERFSDNGDILYKQYKLEKDNIEFFVLMEVVLKINEYDISMRMGSGNPIKYCGRTYKRLFEMILKEYRKEWYIKNG